jgi:hypothetical protein
MKWTVALIAATALVSASAHAQNSRVQEPNAKNGQPLLGSPRRQIPEPRLVRRRCPWLRPWRHTDCRRQEQQRARKSRPGASKYSRREPNRCQIVGPSLAALQLAETWVLFGFLPARKN